MLVTAPSGITPSPNVNGRGESRVWQVVHVGRVRRAEGNVGRMAEPPLSPEELDRVAATVESWLKAQHDNPVVLAVERDESGAARWFVRLTSDEKGVYSIWLTLQQRTLHHETYLMPAPIENRAECYEQLLRRNLHLHGVQLAIGGEDAVYLVGRVPADDLDDDVLDGVLGAHYAAVELCFRPAMRIGYASLFQG